MKILWYIVIGLIAGWLAGMIMKREGFGWIGNLVVGVIGALIGGFLHNIMGELFTATVGSILFLLALRHIRITIRK